MNEAHNFHDPAEQPGNRAYQEGMSRHQSVTAIQNWLKGKLAEYLEIELDDIDVAEPFASYGLPSVDAVGLSGDLEDWLGRTLSPTVVYDYPDIARLARYLAGNAAVVEQSATTRTASEETATEAVAIIGMACRFPGGVTTPEDFWRLLKSGTDTVTEIPAERWDVDKFYDAVPGTPGKMYTRYGCFLHDIDRFDAHFFGISPRETMRMDPQQRLLVEVAWEALENAGLAVSELAGSQTGVFVGMMNNHEYAQLQIQQGDESYVDDPYFGTGSASSIASGRLPYLFDFRGPALALDTACSSSLVAAHLACQSLRNKECNLALAGGVNAIMLPENMVNACKMGMLAVDGQCKTFDAAADGFVLGEGCGIVVLKRLADAVADGDSVLAIIRGSSVNQDGRSNGITAPNKLAQEAVIRKALANAQLDPLRVGYVEAHGSGTALGDPIEIEALSAVLGKERTPEHPLFVGSVKTNIGHLAGAAGIAGLMKTVLALQHREIPAHLHVKQLNPHISWSDHPIAIPTTITPWSSAHETRIAGVSSFGWSGTNAHLILEEGTPVKTSVTDRPVQLLLLSAKTETALEQATDNLASFLQNRPEMPLADIAHTLQTGRNRFEHRRFLVCRDQEDALAALTGRGTNRVLTNRQTENHRPVAFLFPGLGEQYAGMAGELYQTEPSFRQTVDFCCTFLKHSLGLDLDNLLHPKNEWQDATSLNGQKKTEGNGKQNSANSSALHLPTLLGRNEQNGNGHSATFAQLKQTVYAQPLTFIIEYALAQLLMQWGFRPDAMLGYSLGEYVAACLSGVLALEDALTLVTRRAQLISAQPTGVMVAVALSEADVQPFLREQVSLAAINSPHTCVLAGPPHAIQRLEVQWREREIAYRRVETTHAFHSTMLDSLRDELTQLVQTCKLDPPRIPYLSNVTGTWITTEQATDPAYWAAHMCQTVQFASGANRLLQDTECVLLEVGLGQSLGSFVRQQPACNRERMAMVLSTLPSLHERQSDSVSLLTTLGKLWQLGVLPDWKGFYAHEQRRRVSLPTYPFERERYWIDPFPSQTPQKRAHAMPQGKRSDVGDWFYVPGWEKSPLPAPQTNRQASSRPWLVFIDAAGVGEQIAYRLEQEGHIVVRVQPGEQFAWVAERLFTIRPHIAADYIALMRAFTSSAQLPDTIVHCWSISQSVAVASQTDSFTLSQERGLYSLLYLAQALGSQVGDEDEVSRQLVVVSNNMQCVTNHEELSPEKATLLAACKVIPQEYHNLTCRSIDLLASEPVAIDALMVELLVPHSAIAVAYRNGERWIQTFKPKRLEQPATERLPLRKQGVYLITGGLGGLGLVLAEYLAKTVQARLVLLSRSAMPLRHEWNEWLATHETADTLSGKIRSVQALEALGAEVLLLQGDVADAARMQQIISQVYTHFGVIHGVIHAAGIFDETAFGVIQEIDPVAVCEAHFRPKVYGTLALQQALQDCSLDFCVLFSSLVSVLGGLGFVGYTAANAYMDALAHKHNQTETTRWTSLGWDIWQVKEERHGVHRYGVMGSTVSLYSMTAQEGLDAFARMLAVRNETHIITSTGDIEERIRRWVHLETVQESTHRTTSTRAAKHVRPALSTAYVPANGDDERKIAAILQDELGIAEVGLYDNFFDLGGNSLLGLQVIARLKKAFHMQIPAVALFEAPTVSALAKYVRPQQEIAPDQHRDIFAERRQRAKLATRQDGVAIIGMSGRFPGASSVEQLWQNLCDGVESITFFTDEELLAAGVDLQLVQHPNYVKARPIMRDIDLFDANFFGYSPREAELTDPQHRFFLECSWEALELAGYDPYTYEGLISVFGGSNISTYLLELAARSDVLQSVDGFQLGVGNDKDSLTTTVSYKLNLKGPSFAVQTFCSTSLVATHLACQHLLHGECDIALAGGVSIRVPTISGHMYQEGGMESPDGHCRTFDAAARGSIFGDGVAVVVLKRLSDALADGDTIYAVIKGSAINNDGSLKVSYSAPSVAGQAEVVSQALLNAGVSAESISYVEAHGTATELGDPIEVASLTRAYRKQTDDTGYCAIGSAKTNLGHLDRAAGATGLIKAALALTNEQIPASLHYQSPNPEIDFAHSPFYVNTKLSSWHRAGKPRRAGVNSLGMGGTNAHVVLEEAPLPEPTSPSRPWQLLLLSAKTETALKVASANLYTYLQTLESAPLADVAYTLQVGRSAFEHRQVIVCRDREDALSALQPGAPSRHHKRYQTKRDRPVAFLFPGVGEQYVSLIQQMYQQETAFRETINSCCRLLKETCDVDLHQVLFSSQSEIVIQNGTATNGNGKASLSGLDLRALLGRNGQNGSHNNGHHTSTEQFKQTALAQPALFICEYALAQLLMQWGIRPQAMLGYSLGEYVAACLSGVLSLKDALLLVTRRAQLIQAEPAGAMLAVALPEQELAPYLSEQVSLAVINAPNTCVLSGSVEAIARVEQQLCQREIACRRVETTHAFHSTLLNVLRDPLTELARSVTLHAPQIPYISDVTGTWITPEQATDPTYWVQHMCQTVRFADGVAHLLQDTEYLLLEVGPGQSLSSFVRQHPACTRERMQNVFSTFPSEHERQPALAFLLTTLGKLWLAGATIDWAAFYARERRRRVPLPTYPFERQRYWLEPKKRAGAVPGSVAFLPADDLGRKTSIADWFYLPLWKQAIVPFTPSVTALLAQKQCWAIFADDCGIGSQVVDQLLRYGQDVLTVMPGSSFDRHDEYVYSIRPDIRADYDALFKALRERGLQCQHIVHLWTVTARIQSLTGSNQEEMLKRGFYSLLALAQALGDSGLEQCAITIVSNEVHDVIGNESLCPEKATMAGPCRVIPQEYPNITCRSIDIALAEAYEQRGNVFIQRLIEELMADSAETVVALRGNRRWVQTFEPLPLPEQDVYAASLREGGVYLITGGLGGIGLAVADYLARTVSAKLVLVGRTGLPPRHGWQHILESQGEASDVGRRIRTILNLEASGAKVLALQADVSDEAQMRDVVRQAVARFGTVHGVFHAAGVPGAGLIQLKTPEQAARTLLPKVEGTLALEQSLRGIPLDFLVLFSSITSTTGSPGQVDYCAANAFLDAFARSRSHEHGLTIAIDWSEWQWNAWEDGMAGYGEMGAFLKENRQRFGLTFEEGMEALTRALASQKPHVIVSTQDFNNVVALSKSFTVAALLQEKRQDATRQTTHLRPALETSYVAPGNELQRKIAGLWEQILGIERVGINDNFFDLGGNSLLGIDLIASMRKALHVEDLPAYVLYEAPSVEAMAMYLEQSKTAVPAAKTHERSERRRESLKQRMRETRRAR